MESGQNGKRIFLAILILLFVAGTSFIVGARYAGRYGGQSVGNALFANSQVSAVQPINVDFTPFWKAWNTIESKYVPVSTSTVVTDEEKVWGAIKGLAASVGDPYTVFLPPADNEVFAEDISGNFEGVGMEIGMRAGLLTVIAPLKGTPAERAGVLPGDVIIRIDGAPTDNLAIDEAVKLIRGEGGTTVTLTIAREGESEFIDIPIVRDVIEIPTIQTTLRDDGIFVIALYNFSAVSPRLFQQSLREFVESGSDKLVLDLRGNPGGFLEAAVDMASYFLPVGEVVVREDFGDGQEQQVHRSKGYDIFNGDLSMVVLIDRGSASASEILAGALQEHGIATLVGETSFGKGSVQELVDITSNTSLKVTIARWLTPNGISISQGGLTPDVEVKATAEDIEAGRDPQLEKAAEILLGN